MLQNVVVFILLPLNFFLEKNMYIYFNQFHTTCSSAVNYTPNRGGTNTIEIVYQTNIHIVIHN